MTNPIRDLLSRFGDQFAGYAPHLFVGLVLIACGWILGWVARRVIMRLCVILRIDRWLRRLRWGRAFALGDVRYVLYAGLGNLGFAIVFLVLLNAALAAMKLTMLSDLLQSGVVLVPRLIVAGVIAGLGWLASVSAANAVEHSLRRENTRRAGFVAQFVRSMVFVFFCSMALAELDVAREIVVIGFTVVFVTLGGIAIVLTLRGTKPPAEKRSDEPDA